MNANESKPHWRAKCDQALVKTRILRDIGSALLATGFVAAVVYYLHKSGHVKAILAGSIWLLAMLYMALTSVKRFKFLLSCEYLIAPGKIQIMVKDEMVDEPTSLQLQRMHLQCLGNYVNLIWEEPETSSKGAWLMPPKGFMYVSDINGLKQALQEFWPQLRLRCSE